MIKPVHLLSTLAIVAIVLLSCAGVAAYLDWIPAPAVSSANAFPRQLSQTPAPPVCGRCGVIETVREVRKARSVDSRGSVTGAALGQQLVGFSQSMTNVLGLLMVALAGGPAGLETGPSTVREVTVRFEDGSSRALIESKAAPLKTGDRVKVINGRILPMAETAPAAVAAANP